MVENSIKPVILLAAFGLFAASLGCRSSGLTFDPRYDQLSHDLIAIGNHPAGSMSVANPVADNLSGPQPVDVYLEIGLQQNSEIQEARLEVESLANRVPQAASLPDPMLGATTFAAPVQTAAGKQDFGLSMNQKLPARGKLGTRAAMAEADVDAARARLLAVELKVVEQIKSAYYQLYFYQQAIAIVERDREQLKLIENVVDRMYRVQQQVSQQDVLQVQVALSKIDTELLQFEQQRSSAQAKLARLLHVSPETDLEAMEPLPSGQIVRNIDQLYETAIQSRPELHAQLATIRRGRQAVCLAELENSPDLTLGFNWIATSSNGISPVANGDDAFLLTLGMNLPVYRTRIDAGVREAQARTLADARKYDRLRDETMEEVADLFARITTLQETLALFRGDIIPKQQLTFDQSIDDYQVGKVDFLQMMNNWSQLLRYHIQEKRLESDLQQALASLARQLGNVDLPQPLATVRPELESK